MSQSNVTVLVGDLLESKAHTLVNTVNTVGVMGKGIALKFRKRFPDMHEDYLARCERGQVRLGEPYLFERLIPPWILNFPTKEHWRSVSKLSDIVTGLEYLESNYKSWGIESLAVPPLGCGLGGLEWRVVGRTLYRHLRRLDLPVELFAPFGTPTSEMSDQFLIGDQDSIDKNSLKVRPGGVALVEVLNRVLSEPHHWPIGRTTFQKLAYFGTEVGLPTGLEFSKGSYGPYSSDLKSLTVRLVNNGLIREERLGQMFAIFPGPTFEDARDAFSKDLGVWEEKIDKVADLCLRFRTTNDAEVAATVHFTARNLAERPGASVSEKQVLEAVQQWKFRRRPPVSAQDIALAIRALEGIGWIDAKPSEDLPLPDEELMTV